MSKKSKKSRTLDGPVTNEFRVRMWRSPVTDEYYVTVSPLNKRWHPESTISSKNPVDAAEGIGGFVSAALIRHLDRISGVDTRPPQDRTNVKARTPRLVETDPEELRKHLNDLGIAIPEGAVPVKLSVS